MFSFFPLFYSIGLFGILSLICYYIFIRMKSNYITESKIQLSIRNLEKDSLIDTSIYAKLAALYIKRKFFYKALLLLKRQIKNSEINDHIGIGYNYYTIAMAYSNLKKPNLAQYYYSISKTLLIYSRFGSYSGLGSSL